jgi:DNA-binding NarL/FixJ family response regulator
VTDWLTIPVDDLPSAIPAEQRERLGVTERQLQVIQLLALGQQNKQISRAMGLSATTVNVMRHHIKVRMRLKASSRSSSPPTGFSERNTHAIASSRSRRNQTQRPPARLHHVQDRRGDGRDTYCAEPHR